MVEYIDQHITSLSWQISNRKADITAPDCCGENIITGSASDISIWQFIQKPTGFDQSLPIIEAASAKVQSRVSRSRLIGNIAFTALIDGKVQLHELLTDKTNCKSLKLLLEAKNLHSNHKCNDMLFCAQTNSVITCGNDGGLSSFNIDHPNKITSKKVSESSLKCMDMINPNEVICGTQTGCLEHYDLRTHECCGSFANRNLSALTCLQRNPNVNHLAIGGNDQGSLVLYDLRNAESAVLQISAHLGAVTNVKYRPRDSGIVYSSSCDGDLFRWNLNSEFTSIQMLKKVESVGEVREPLSITSFDINHLGDLLYTTDHGAILYRKLNEFG